MGKNLINIALFGLGRIGLLHAKNLTNNKNFNLKYIFDINKKVSKKISKSLNCKNIENTQIALKDKNIDCIFISSPTATHLKLIFESVKNGKTVFCEKPLDLNLNKILKYEKKINKFKHKIQIGFNRRYDTGHSLLKNSLKKGKIGKLEKIIITSRDPAAPSIKYLKASGGIFKDMMIHDFDLARYYAGNDKFVSIFATGSNISNKYFNKLKDFELATAVLKTKSGIQCVISNSRHCSFGYDQRVELFGSKGMVISDNVKQNEISEYSNKNTNAGSNFKHFFTERYEQAYKDQLNDLAKLFKKNLRPKTGFIDGKISIQIAESAIQSIKSKKFEKIKY